MQRHNDDHPSSSLSFPGVADAERTTTSTVAMATTTTGGAPPPPVPVLLPRLRAALRFLYSLPAVAAADGNGHYTPQQRMEAHSFLISFQSRNARRVDESKLQSRRDSAAAAATSPTVGMTTSEGIDDSGDAVVEEEDDGAHRGGTGTSSRCGSTWLACLVLLGATDDAVHGAERLFAAQTMRHRLGRMKLVEAVDFEFEPGFDGGGMGWYLALREWTARFHPYLHGIMFRGPSRNLGSLAPGGGGGGAADGTDEEEERVKGEVTILSMCGLALRSALTHYRSLALIEAASAAAATAHPRHHYQQHFHNEGPLLSTLGGGIALAALRMRYTTRSVSSSSSTGGSAAIPEPLISIVTLSVRSASHAAIEAGGHGPSLLPGRRALGRCTAEVLSALPDALLGSSGGARGRTSLDPRCIRAAASELRHTPTGSDLFLRALSSACCFADGAGDGGGGVSSSSVAVDVALRGPVLDACAGWASFLPVTAGFVDSTVPALVVPCLCAGSGDANTGATAVAAAYRYLIAIFEGATVTVDDVVASSLGVARGGGGGGAPSATPNPAAGGGVGGATAKGKTSRARRRMAAKLRDGSTSTLRTEAAGECRRRRDVACRVAAAIVPHVTAANGVLAKALAAADSAPHSSVDGEGPLGCVATCASACLPHLIALATSTAADDDANGGGGIVGAEDEEERRRRQRKEATGLFASIMGEFLLPLSRSANRSARRMAHEPLVALHEAMVSVDVHGHCEPSFISVCVDNIFSCIIALAGGCAYPDGYFNNLGEDGDEDLENERNDVRDVLRTVTSPPASGDAGDGTDRRLSRPVSIALLRRLVEACHEAVTSSPSASSGGSVAMVPPEIAVHTFSALSKPLHALADGTVDVGNDDEVLGILCLIVRTLGRVCEQLLAVFEHSPQSAISVLPVSRLASLATATFSPLFSLICKLPQKGAYSVGEEGPLQVLLSATREALALSIEAAATSTLHLPELIAPSTLGDTVYDIRGAMRGPGGEDHVGVLALMRLAHESDELTETILFGRCCRADLQDWATPCRRATSLISSLVGIHGELARIELARGPGVSHGRGCAPKSRRILLNTICHLGLAATGRVTVEMAGSGELLSSVTTMQRELFTSPLLVLAQSRNPQDTDEVQYVYRLCEATFDLASFPAEMIGTLLDAATHHAEPLTLQALQNLITVASSGYRADWRTNTDKDALCTQWGRLRAAVFSLFSACLGPSAPPMLSEAAASLIHTECSAVLGTFSAQSRPSSMIFVEGVIGNDTLPAGAFVMLLGDIFESATSRATARHLSKGGSGEAPIRALHKMKDSVFEVLLLKPSTTESRFFADPRPTIAEAWYLSMTRLARFCHLDGLPSDPLALDLLVESCAAAVHILLLKCFRKRRKGTSCLGEGMTMDAPHTLAIIDFLESTLSLGPIMLEPIGERLRETIPVDFGVSAEVFGGVIIGAVLFRTISGLVPPWAVEGAPGLYSSLFLACGRNTDTFCKVVRASTEVRLSSASEGFLGVAPGEKLAGPFLEKLSQPGTDRFMAKVKLTSERDDKEGWRRFKVDVKQVCGGKKKAAGFNLKPSLTVWDCDRM